MSRQPEQTERMILSWRSVTLQRGSWTRAQVARRVAQQVTAQTDTTAPPAAPRPKLSTP